MPCSPMASPTCAARSNKSRLRSDPVDSVVAVAAALIDYCVANPARYHLMLQRTLPSFSPSEDSYRVALGYVNVPVGRLSAAGITDPADIALIRGLISGLAAEQIANEPQGRVFADHADRGIRALVTTCVGSTDNSPWPSVKSLKDTSPPRTLNRPGFCRGSV
jgi:hypothetical protein